jgi:hypothetical protein
MPLQTHADVECLRPITCSHEIMVMSCSKQLRDCTRCSHIHSLHTLQLSSFGNTNQWCQLPDAIRDILPDKPKPPTPGPLPPVRDCAKRARACMHVPRALSFLLYQLLDLGLSICLAVGYAWRVPHPCEYNVDHTFGPNRTLLEAMRPVTLA